MEFDYDLFVIGGGSGGVRAARLTALGGQRVALAEESRMGGTCVIRGCVPKKLMVFASEYPGAIQQATQYGWDAQVGAFDWTAFKDHLNSELSRLEGAYEGNAEKAGVEIFKQRAKVADAHTVELADGTRKTAKHILIAVGGRPSRPDMPGADLGLVSDDLFDLPQLPKKMLIVGAGYIGCEFACVFNGLGVDVQMFIRKAQILRGFDDEARGHVADCMQQRGVTLHTGCAPTAIEKRGDRIWVKGSNGHEDEFDALLWATGRTPNTAGLGLEDVGVKLNRRGAIEVDEYGQTAVPSIYALGDVIGRVELTPVAIREAIAFHETVFKGNRTKMDYDLIPSATFTQPEMGTVGLTEEQAEEQEPTLVYATAFRPMQSAFAGGAERVLFKMLVSKDTDKVLGVHIVGPSAAEMIQFVAVALKMGATKADFDRTCAVHPAMAEEMVTMKDPVRVLA
ncbi:glutathione-disulfide reductase [Jannaschia pagri]|uniref:Glutathione-disulfide reductase n=1 Tax=Jannaschia pagri TaxID=2829797 RepID=A0ABQ4NKU6_9RHOB|nr:MULTISPECIES: glutathione-disulfide reductase [unclassified Jannaschia]GIT90891.1 glutathione-disulfide reductase [Jannaschia sp. AI_61]GIT94722.1 glutathione-disulfide reductase [Jannaschia sp. AI_62]